MKITLEEKEKIEQAELRIVHALNKERDPNIVIGSVCAFLIHFLQGIPDEDKEKVRCIFQYAIEP